MSLLRSSHAVLPHKGHDTRGRAGFREKRVLEQLLGGGPLGRVPNQHPVQETLKKW